MSNSVLFQPFALHDLTLPNRIVLAPMTRSRAGIARLSNTLMAEYYAQRSSAGLLVTEATTISEEANGWNESPGVYTDEMTEGWKHTTEAVHEKGGVIFLQLWHLGRSSHSSFHGGKPAVAPSAIKINEPTIHTPTGKQPHEVPRALETSEMPRVVEDYRKAAARAKAAGFDGVEVHSAWRACRRGTLRWTGGGPRRSWSGSELSGRRRTWQQSESRTPLGGANRVQGGCHIRRSRTLSARAGRPSLSTRPVSRSDRT